MAIPPTIINPMANIVIALMKTQSDPSSLSAIELGARTHARWFAVYVTWIVFAAIVSVILTWLLWRAGNKEQDAVIVETREETLILERAASDAKIAQQRVEIRLAEARTAQAAAEKSLLEIQERIKWRDLGDRAEFVSFLKQYEPGPVLIRCSSENAEARNFVVEIDSALKEAGRQESSVNLRDVMIPEPIGLIFWVHSADSIPEYAGALQLAFKAIDFPTRIETREAQERGTLVLVVGSKPQS